MTPAILMTGASSGLGTALAAALRARGAGLLILPVRREPAAERLSGSVGGAIRAPLLDLASLASVRQFLEGFARAPVPLDAIILNAGVQAGGPLRMTGDGFEETFAVNHLAHHLLLSGLLPFLKPGGRVAWTGSGTHDPADPIARRFGFRGGLALAPERIAHGDYGETASAAQTARDAYATSKLLNTLSSAWFARCSAGDYSFFTFDPGLMPGTGLARSMGPARRFGWHAILPLAARFIPGTSTPARSAATYADLVLGRLPLPGNGSLMEFTGQPLAASATARDPDYADMIMAYSNAVLGLSAERVLA